MLLIVLDFMEERHLSYRGFLKRIKDFGRKICRNAAVIISPVSENNNGIERIGLSIQEMKQCMSGENLDIVEVIPGWTGICW